MEGLLKVASSIVTILILLAILSVCAGQKPKPCPPHICLPKSRIVTAEQLAAQRAEAGKQSPTTSAPKSSDAVANGAEND